MPPVATPASAACPAGCPPPCPRAPACGRQRAGRFHRSRPRGLRRPTPLPEPGPRQLRPPAAAMTPPPSEPQRPPALADALGNLDPAHQIRVAGEQSKEPGGLGRGAVAGQPRQRRRHIRRHRGQHPAGLVDQIVARAQAPDGERRPLGDVHLEAIGKHALDAGLLDPGQGLDPLPRSPAVEAQHGRRARQIDGIEDVAVGGEAVTCQGHLGQAVAGELDHVLDLGQRRRRRTRRSRAGEHQHGSRARKSRTRSKAGST